MNPRPEEVILRVVSETFGVPVEAMTGRRCQQNIVIARRASMKLMKELVPYFSRRCIAHVLGRSPSGVSKGLTVFEEWLKQDRHGVITAPLNRARELAAHELKRKTEDTCRK